MHEERGAGRDGERGGEGWREGQGRAERGAGEGRREREAGEEWRECKGGMERGEWGGTERGAGMDGEGWEEGLGRTGRLSLVTVKGKLISQTQGWLQSTEGDNQRKFGLVGCK